MRRARQKTEIPVTARFDELIRIWEASASVEEGVAKRLTGRSDELREPLPNKNGGKDDPEKPESFLLRKDGALTMKGDRKSVV